MTRRLITDLGHFGPVLMPEDAVEEPILAKPVRNALTEWLTEIWSKDALADVGLKARMRAIFHGAPGTGKTTLAHHIAARLGLPMLKVRAEKLHSQYIGESGVLVGRLFDLLAEVQTPVFLFFDEFDSLGAKRMGSGRNEVAEQDHNHMVNVLLANFDRYDGFIVAATNFGDRVDEAVWRRFEIQIKIELPEQGERREILRRYLKPFILPDDPLDRLADAFSTGSPALMRSACEHLKRQIVIGPLAKWDMSRDAVISRLLASVQPHPDIGKPRLWSHGADDHAIRTMPWPLQRSLDAYPQTSSDVVRPGEAAAVVPLRRKGGEK